MHHAFLYLLLLMYSNNCNQCSIYCYYIILNIHIIFNIIFYYICSMENTTRIKRQVVDVKDVNDLRKLLNKGIEHKKLSHYKVYRQLDMLPMTLRSVLKESDSGFNVSWLLKLMKILDIKFVIETERANILDEEV